MAASSSKEECCIPECQKSFRFDPTTGQTTQFHCEKNPGHENFTPITELKMEDIPSQLRNEQTMECIQYFSKLTVMVFVAYNSNDRPEAWRGTDIPFPYNSSRGSDRVFRSSTGTIVPQFNVRDGPCPCPICERSDEPKEGYWEVLVNTATQEVFNDEEAACTSCECFYYSEDKKEVVEIYGIRCHRNGGRNLTYDDGCTLVCVTHDQSLVDRLSAVDRNFHMKLPGNWTFMISHAHGLCQQLTFGRVLYKTDVKSPGVSVTCNVKKKGDTKTYAKCRLPLFPWSRYNQAGSRYPDDYIVIPKAKMTPGTEFMVPLEMVFIPNDGEYICITHYTSDDFPKTFQTGTYFFIKKTSLFFPPETEFIFEDPSPFEDESGELIYSYLTHEIDTCRGSSGARIQPPCVGDGRYVSHAYLSKEGSISTVFSIDAKDEANP